MSVANVVGVPNAGWVKVPLRRPLSYFGIVLKELQGKRGFLPIC